MSELSIKMSDGEFVGNTAKNGGAIWVDGKKGMLSINGTQIKQNSAIQEGGGLGFRSLNHARIERTSIESNQAGEVGGGMSFQVIIVRWFSGSQRSL